MSTIKGPVTITVDLGSPRYTSPLTISSSGSVEPTAAGATAVYSHLTNGSLDNEGAVTGGAGTYFNHGLGVNGAGGIGVDFNAAGTVENGGQIYGGAGGGAAVFTAAGYGGGNGGVGVVLSAAGATFNDAGGTTGGAGGAGYRMYSSGVGGAGIDLTTPGTRAIISGHLTGGAGGSGYYTAGIGGAGAIVTGGALVNGSDIVGGLGGSTLFNDTPAAAGGVGVDLAGGTVSNAGSITGGGGGYGDEGGGNGGNGLSLNGGIVTNKGTISGGGGGDTDPGGAGGNGGVGVYLDGGELITSGVIQGGFGGTRFTTVRGDAVQFGAPAGKLIVDPGAVFNGQVAANTNFKDILELAGRQSGGTPITLGRQFTDFSTLEFGSGAAWTVDVAKGAAAAPGGMAIEGFATGSKIDITNLTPSAVAADFNPNTDVLTTPADGTLHFIGSFSGEYFAFSSDGAAGTDITLVKGSGISTTITEMVTLGSAAHLSPLTITETGVVRPTAHGATGVLSTRVSNHLTNNGLVQGGAGALGAGGGTGGTGGVGVNFKAAGTITNTATIVGGAGGNHGGSGRGGGGTGGAAVEMTGGALSNHARIDGGTGGSGGPGAGGVGGAGVDLTGGTLSSSGLILGGSGGSGGSGGTGGGGGTGVSINGGTLVTSGRISGGVGGSGVSHGAAGDAIKFGAAAGTLVVDPGAVFVGNVVADTAANDVLELSGKQSGGAPITLGTQFSGFTTLEFASGAKWTADATTADLTAHRIHIDGFAIGDAFDITTLTEKGTTQSFNRATDQLTLTHGATVVTLDFNSSVSADHFVLSAAGSGTDLTLAAGAHATLAALGADVKNFVSDHHRALMDAGTSNMHGMGSSLSLMPAVGATAQDFAPYGFESHALIDHGVAHAALGLCKT